MKASLAGDQPCKQFETKKSWSPENHNLRCGHKYDLLLWPICMAKENENPHLEHNQMCGLARTDSHLPEKEKRENKQTNEPLVSKRSIRYLEGIQLLQAMHEAHA